MSNPIGDYDSPWKEALEEYLEDFLALFFPHIHADIDWSVPVTFLDAELQQVVRDAEVGLLRVDRLVQVRRRDGQDVWVLLHVEVQAQEDGGFARRMYAYNTRIYERYDRDTASLAVLADENPTWRPSGYRRELWGCSDDFAYPILKLADWRTRRDELEASDNPFATVVLAHLAAQDTRRDVHGRQAVKLALVRRLYDKGYSRERVLSLFRFIDWLLALPEAAERAVERAIAQFEGERRMPYITGIERRAIERGLETGRQEGRQEGLQEGRLEEARRAVRRIVERRFGTLPADLDARLAQTGDLATLEALLDTAITAAGLEEVAGGLTDEE